MEKDKIKIRNDGLGEPLSVKSLYQHYENQIVITTPRIEPTINPSKPIVKPTSQDLNLQTQHHTHAKTNK